MTPENKIKREMLLERQQDEPDLIDYGPLDSDETVEAAYDRLIMTDSHWDAENEFREGQVETNIEAPYSRNYEGKSVARKMVDGTWVGWTYWYGGGKHANPEAIEWMEHAYSLDCKEETKVVVVQTFTKIDEGIDYPEQDLDSNEDET